ncbi:hypothetical protein B0H14DRAFT_2618372 [Mycena olivaceomarginata]|nr:hypothetical protein B0H14DRAFT_2618372 [Mycena olivaceomarginata]
MTTNESDFTFPQLGTETAIFPAASVMEFHNIDPSTFYSSPAPRAKSSRAPLQIPATPTPIAQLPTVPPRAPPPSQGYARFKFAAGWGDLLPPFIFMQQDLDTKQDIFHDSYPPGELLLTSLTRTHSTPHTWSVMAMLGMYIKLNICCGKFSFECPKTVPEVIPILSQSFTMADIVGSRFDSEVHSIDSERDQYEKPDQKSSLLHRGHWICLQTKHDVGEIAPVEGTEYIRNVTDTERKAEVGASAAFEEVTENI